MAYVFDIAFTDCKLQVVSVFNRALQKANPEFPRRTQSQRRRPSVLNLLLKSRSRLYCLLLCREDALRLTFPRWTLRSSFLRPRSFPIAPATCNASWTLLYFEASELLSRHWSRSYTHQKTLPLLSALACLRRNPSCLFSPQFERYLLPVQSSTQMRKLTRLTFPSRRLIPQSLLRRPQARTLPPLSTNSACTLLILSEPLLLLQTLLRQVAYSQRVASCLFRFLADFHIKLLLLRSIPLLLPI